MFWFIFCFAIEDFYYEVKYTDLNAAEYQDNFIVYYELYNKDLMHNMVTLIYYAFTTLSTVGFGDYAPRSDAERILGTVIFLMGVSIFSFVLGIFSDLLQKLNEFNGEPEDDVNLSKFLGVLQKFNKNKPLDKDFLNDIQKQFEYKWINDRTATFKG
jgi:hypothetical protein